MRILLIAAAAMLAPASAAAPPAADPSKPAAERTVFTSETKAADKCRPTSVHRASPFRPDDPVRPRKLGELPPATGYKAVYRTVDGCEVPMTVAEYQRNPGR